MSNHVALPGKWVRARRITSLVLSITSGIGAAGILILFITRPSSYLGTGAFGLPPLQAILLNSFAYLPGPAIAAVLLAGTLPRKAKTGSLHHRLPMILAIIASCLVGAYLLLPLATVLFSLLTAILLF